LPYPNFRLHLTPFNALSLQSLHHQQLSILSTYRADYSPLLSYVRAALGCRNQAITRFDRWSLTLGRP
jgi:hypothetical protein